ncbi:MAG: hypothetical protein ACRCXB_07425 [Aeromonadaceae bacterium]
MIDFGNLEASLRGEIADGNGEDSCDLTNVGLLELITRLRQAEKDAARYRFIKEWNQSYSLNVYRKELWDEIVDKAIWMESQCNKVRD